jgi:hydrogenase maturation protease
MTFSKTIIIGLGNPLLGDDSVGWRVAEQVRKLCAVEVDCLSVGGLSLMERLVGYDRAILIDAITTGKQPTGSVSLYKLEELPDLSAGHTGSAHDTSLQNALKLGQLMGVQLPTEVVVVGIEAQSVYEFSEVLSPPVAAAIPQAVQMVMELLKE